MFLRFMAAAVLSCSVCGHVLAAQPITLALRADVTLDHARVVLADVASVAGADADSVRALEQLEIARAPRVAYVEKLSRARIEQLIRRQAGAGSGTLVWRGADAVTLRTAVQTITFELVSQAAKKYLLQLFGAAHPGLHVDVRAASAPLAVPVGAYQLTARPLAGIELGTHMPVWIDVIVDGAPYRSVLVPLSVSVMQDAFVARWSLAEGAQVDVADFDARTTNVAGSGALPTALPPQPWRLRRGVARGQVLTQAMLPVAGAVSRGDAVRVLVTTSGITIETTGIAMHDAAPNQRLGVRSIASNEVVTGRLTSAGTVTVGGI